VTYGNWLAAEIARRRISQRSLAARCGVDHSTISRIVSDGVDPNMSTALRIARVAGWPPPQALIPASRLGAAEG
jgi:transcriptional regulator with XRE-family HTH domain